MKWVDDIDDEEAIGMGWKPRDSKEAHRHRAHHAAALRLDRSAMGEKNEEMEGNSKAGNG